MRVQVLAAMLLGLTLACCSAPRQPYNLPVFSYQTSTATPAEVEINAPIAALDGNVHLSPTLETAHQSTFHGEFAETNGFGKVYVDMGQIGPHFLQSIAPPRTWAVIPYVTVARQIGAGQVARTGFSAGDSNACPSGNSPETCKRQQTDTVSTYRAMEYLLPGIEAGLHTGGLGYHLAGELYSYQRPGNYTVKAGLTYPAGSPRVDQYAVVLERRSWNVDVNPMHTDVKMNGFYDAAYLKGMLILGWNLALGLGGFHEEDRLVVGNTPARERARDGAFLLFETTVGLMDW